MGPLPKWCEPLGPRQRYILFFVHGLLLDAARALAAAGRSLDRSLESYAIGIALRIFERFIDPPDEPVDIGYPPLPLTRRQRHIVRAISLAVGFAAAGFRRWFERDQANPTGSWANHQGIGLQVFLARALLDWAFSQLAARKAIAVDEATVRKLGAIDWQLTDWMRKERREHERVRRGRR